MCMRIYCTRALCGNGQIDITRLTYSNVHLFIGRECKQAPGYNLNTRGGSLPKYNVLSEQQIRLYIIRFRVT